MRPGPGQRFVVDPQGGWLPTHLVHFARLLRRAGLALGPGHVLEAARALSVIDPTRRQDFHAALCATLVSNHRERALFDQAFDLYWRDPRRLEDILAALLPSIDVPRSQRPPTVPRRLDEALRQTQGRSREARPPARRPEAEEVELDAAMSYAPGEVSRRKDFEDMSVAEIRAAEEAIARMRPSFAEYPTRRYRPDARGARVDMRATLRASGGGELIALRYRRRRKRPPPVVVLCDISGSMERYSRMLLHFMHVLGRRWQRVHSFVFGTRLTDITRDLRHRDVDRALAAAASRTRDWAGGTRIGACLRAFNHRYSRRVLGQGAVVLLITDGLDREAADGIADEMARLRRSCRRLIWLNPLLRYAGFEPRAAGIRAILPHVDEHRPVHDLQSLTELARALSEPTSAGSDRRGGRRIP